MKNKKSFRKWLKNLFNKKEVAIVIIDPKIIDELAENLKELDKSLKEFNSKRQFKGVPPIPDYKKGSKGDLAIVTDNKGEKYRESIVLPDGQKITLSNNHKIPTPQDVYDLLTKSQTEKHFSDSIGYALNNPEVREKMFEKSKAYWKSFLDKSEPFAHPIENKEPKIDYHLMFGQTSKSECIGDFSERIKASFEYWYNVWNERLKSIPNHNKNSLFGNYKPNCNHSKIIKSYSYHKNTIHIKSEKEICSDCHEIVSIRNYTHPNCKHQKVITTQYFEPISGKVIFTSKVCNNCNADLLK